MTAEQCGHYFERLKSEYSLFAPVVLKGKGSFTDTDSVRYQEVSTVEEIEFRQKSHFSAREVLLPITQTLFYFTEDHWLEPKTGNKKILLFLRSCDIHAIKRLDEIYLRNGSEDPYYKAVRERIRFCLIECTASFPNCFCVSMNTNQTTDYDLVLRSEGEYVYVGVNNKEFGCSSGQPVTFEPQFVTCNETALSVPESLPASVAAAGVWQEYSARCSGCGRCSFVCPTCTCFSMQDIFYKDNANAGERRRVWASCMVDGFTDMAGGHSCRKSQADRMRFRVMHKFHDYRKRFGYDMCVGCGRCDDICPEYISLAGCINKLNAYIEEVGK
ncbi:anaerobic sulfite reductase subunit AsrA [Methylomusa anaerophila]|nr:anaerobic sulfite reductase subunit AsrA [Methylomusa anaerophila]